MKSKCIIAGKFKIVTHNNNTQMLYMNYNYLCFVGIVIYYLHRMCLRFEIDIDFRVENNNTCRAIVVNTLYYI